jgi:hypothetical protein
MRENLKLGNMGSIIVGSASKFIILKPNDILTAGKMKIAPNFPPIAEVATCRRLAALVPVVAAGVDTSTT